MTATTLLICTDLGRASLLARAERSLPQGEVVVQVKDLVGRRRSCYTRVTSRSAELIASEPPLLLRGGLTVLVSYYRVPADDLGGVESHFEKGEPSHAYDVQLRVACHGRRPAPALTA